MLHIGSRRASLIGKAADLKSAGLITLQSSSLWPSAIKIQPLSKISLSVFSFMKNIMGQIWGRYIVNFVPFLLTIDTFLPFDIL